MCVSCHQRNPSDRIAAPTLTTQAANRHGSHWVTYTYADTFPSGGYPDDGGKTSVGRYIHRGPWAATPTINVSTGSSRYTTGTAEPYLTNVTPLAGATIDNTYQLICESCHSITRNIGPKKLLAQAIPNATLADNGATLCIGCHGDMRHEINNEPPYFKTTGVQDHHRNQAANITNGWTAMYNGTGSESARTPNVGLDQLSLAVYDNANLWGWAVGPGAPPTAVPLAGSEREIIPVAVTVTNGVTIPSTGELHCSSCHRAHNAVSSTGALIIQAGTPTGVAFGAMTAEDTNLGWVKLQRQVGSPKSYTTKLVQDDNGLCIACHASK